jgi:hypothetical protein
VVGEEIIPLRECDVEEEGSVSVDCKTTKRWLERGSSVWWECDVQEESSVSEDCKTM